MELNLETVEQEIARAEEYLATARSESSGSSRPASGGTGDSQKQKSTITEERRREILAKLSAERLEKKITTANETGEPRSQNKYESGAEVVARILESTALPKASQVYRQNTTTPTSTSSAPIQSADSGDAGSKRYTTPEDREKLIQRLLQERRTQKDGEGSGADASTLPYSVVNFGPKQATAIDQQEEEKDDSIFTDSSSTEATTTTTTSASIPAEQQNSRARSEAAAAADAVAVQYGMDLPAGMDYGDDVFFAGDITPPPTGPQQQRPHSADAGTRQSPPEAAVPDATPSRGVSRTLEDYMQEYQPGEAWGEEGEEQSTESGAEVEIGAGLDRQAVEALYMGMHTTHRGRSQAPGAATGASTEAPNAAARAAIAGAGAGGSHSRAGAESGSGTGQRQPLHKRSRRKEAVARELEEQRLKECTFKPKINKWKGSSKVATGEQRLTELSKSREGMYARREKERLQRELKNVEECTFKPKVKKAAPDTHGRSRHPHAHDAVYMREPVAERLYREGDIREQALAATRRHVEMERQTQFSFRPSINPHTDEIVRASKAMARQGGYRPIHERVGDLQREKRAQLCRLRAKAESGDKNTTFAPKIGERSTRLALQKRSQDMRTAAADATKREQEARGQLLAGAGQMAELAAEAAAAERASAEHAMMDVTERMNRESREARHRKQARRAEWEKGMADKCSFAPTISSNSKQLLEDQRPELQGVSFLERQQVLQRQQQLRARRGLGAAQCHEQQAKCTFAPDTGNATEVLEHTRPSRLQETEKERITRLSRQEKDEIKAIRQGVSDRYHGQYKYRPEINVISQKLAEVKPRVNVVDELHADTKRRSVHAKAVRERDAITKQQCPFKPKVNTSVPARCRAKDPAKSKADPSVLKEYRNGRINMAEPDTISSKIAHHRKEKQNQQEQCRREREYEEMKVCTFAPQINTDRPVEPTGPVVVRGLGRYLELQEMAKRKTEEQREREEKVFGSGSSQYQKTGHTVPEPFNISKPSESTKARRKKLQDEVERLAMEECTFAPQTMERANKNLIKALLDDTDLTSSMDQTIGLGYGGAYSAKGYGIAA